MTSEEWVVQFGINIIYIVFFFLKKKGNKTTAIRQ